MDHENLSNYRPVSNLSFLSKLTERVVKSRLDVHFSSNSLFNKFQSAYTRFHSTESALVALHNHLICAVSQQKLTGLCLLDLSAAFDTIDHSILLHRLQSWFGIHGTALNWFHSYLSSRSFSVRINSIKSSIFPITCGVPQGSVLGPLLFATYTTPLSHLLSTSHIHHHLYADDTQRFISVSQPVSILLYNIFKTLSRLLLTGCHQIFSLSTSLSLNSLSLASQSSYLNSINHHFLCLTIQFYYLFSLLEILAFYLIIT